MTKIFRVAGRFLETYSVFDYLGIMEYEFEIIFCTSSLGNKLVFFVKPVVSQYLIRVFPLLVPHT